MENQNKLIRKANELVESRYKFDIWETRVFAKMITLIHKDDEDFKTYRIFINDIQKDFGLSKNKDAYTRLKEGARRLMGKVVQITYPSEEGDKILETPVIIGLETVVGKKSFIDVSFHPNMKPYLLQLKSQFLMYDIRNILRISSVYSIRMYELLKQYEKIGFRTIPIEELKDILGVADKYGLYANFKQRILLKSQRDLKKHTDIAFEFEEIKKGRAIVQLKFDITTNNQGQNRNEEISEHAEIPLTVKLLKKLRKFDITDLQTLRKLAADYTPEYIEATLKKCERDFKKKSSKITSKSGYIITALKENYFEGEIKTEKKKATQKAKNKAAEKQAKVADKIKKDFYEKRTKRVQQLRKKHLTEELSRKVLDAHQGQFLYNNVIQALQADGRSKVLEAWIDDYLMEHYLQPEERDLDLYLKSRK